MESCNFVFFFSYFSDILNCNRNCFRCNFCFISYETWYNALFKEKMGKYRKNPNNNKILCNFFPSCTYFYLFHSLQIKFHKRRNILSQFKQNVFKARERQTKRNSCKFTCIFLCIFCKRIQKILMEWRRQYTTQAFVLN